MKSFQYATFIVGKAVNKKLQVNVPDEDGYKSIFQFSSFVIFQNEQFSYLQIT